MMGEIKSSVVMGYEKGMEVSKNIKILTKGVVVYFESTTYGYCFFNGNNEDINRIDAFVLTPYISRFWLTGVRPTGYEGEITSKTLPYVKNDYSLFLDMQGHVRIAFRKEEARDKFDKSILERGAK